MNARVIMTVVAIVLLLSLPSTVGEQYETLVLGKRVLTGQVVYSMTLSGLDGCMIMYNATTPGLENWGSIGKFDERETYVIMIVEVKQ